MAIDLQHEKLITLREAAKYLPGFRNERPSHYSRVLKFVVKGCPHPVEEGRTVHLEALHVGGQWLTSVEALQRFANALTPGLADAGTTGRTVAEGRKAVRQAERDLDKI